MKKSLRNLVLSSAVLIVSAGSLHAMAVSGGAPEPKSGKLAVVISIVLVALGY